MWNLSALHAKPQIILSGSKCSPVFYPSGARRYTRMKRMWKLLSLHAVLEASLSEGICSLMMYITARSATPE